MRKPKGATRWQRSKWRERGGVVGEWGEEEKVELIANTNGPNECRVESSRVVAIREEEIMQIRQGVLALKLRPS